ncbi:hypothetical protein FRACYDRAFT_184511 [Fragilariopsis cylindrus CCMP1102]|uniref:Uncharacterized protein n=1 Tax=Fragilariopsis cylindrus CCMP1102 TaxID=635003 RepID=A0A1E7FIN0_9STRA|nr:hypothetical protein FRACYDRAFT_184511 [Fragilariopsis cylindrus CCMP1102]|eukprot:OEU17643.1 hypothetical protein FRACYDRAFT_184511 [Fragilariopsis cylindrus CCMP1102]
MPPSSSSSSRLSTSLSLSSSSSTTTTSTSTTMCNFCTKQKPALLIQLPIIGRKKRAATPYCLTCYYTTSAVRLDKEKYVSILDKKEQMKQLPHIQHLFSECYLELQQELQQESVRAFTKQQNSTNYKNDPLAAMLNFSSKQQTTMKGPPPLDKREGNINDGGFIRNINVPEHLKKTQEEQREIQNQQLARMNTAASAARRASREVKTITNTTTTTSSSKRRKGSGKSIWNLAMDTDRNTGKLSAVSESYKMSDADHARLLNNNILCTCGEDKDIRSFGNITSRNADVRKGEIWGTDRDEVINRYQCNKCGRTWNEEE